MRLRGGQRPSTLPDLDNANVGMQTVTAFRRALARDFDEMQRRPDLGRLFCLQGGEKK